MVVEQFLFVFDIFHVIVDSFSFEVSLEAIAHNTVTPQEKTTRGLQYYQKEANLIHPHLVASCEASFPQGQSFSFRNRAYKHISNTWFMNFSVKYHVRSLLSLLYHTNKYKNQGYLSRIS